MARKTLMNNNKFSIAPLLIGLGTVVAVNYLMPVIDVACSAICARLNVPMSKWWISLTRNDTRHSNKPGLQMMTQHIIQMLVALMQTLKMCPKKR